MPKSHDPNENRKKLPKIVNDPVHGFIEIPRGLILDVIDTPVLQRLRRIKQMGQGYMVYPGAVHTRFNHALGAMHLMRQALDVLRRKKVEISKKEYKAALIAILMHDVGHGPFSHALESVIIPGLHHEHMSLALMRYLNEQFEGKLDLAIDIFTGKYERSFLHQLVSGQLDMDRMDYLIRDSFFTGVAEGVVGIDRIIKTLNVHGDQLVCEDKGIYSLEKFIVARRLMYWQVYLHKTAVAAEHMLVNTLRRARELFDAGEQIYLPENLGFFFENEIDPGNLSEEVLLRYMQLDDNDVDFAIKQWQRSDDPILADLAHRLMNRRLLKIRLQKDPFQPDYIQQLRKKLVKRLEITPEEAEYYVFSGQLKNQAYTENSEEPILVWFKAGYLMDLSEATDMPSIHALAAPVIKHYLCAPSEVME